MWESKKYPIEVFPHCTTQMTTITLRDSLESLFQANQKSFQESEEQLMEEEALFMVAEFITTNINLFQ